jgi:hypothetical protein
MKDYLAVIGLAVLDEGFRANLFAHGAAATEGLGADLTATDRARLDDFKISTTSEKEVARVGFAAARDGLIAVCKNPPCPYMP